jgi:hypothetical protein
MSVDRWIECVVVVPAEAATSPAPSFVDGNVRN